MIIIPISQQQFVPLSVASGPALQYEGKSFCKLVDEDVEPSAFVTLSVFNSIDASASFLLKHGTGPGRSMTVQPRGSWTLSLKAGTTSVDQRVTTGGSGALRFRLSDAGSFQWYDASANEWSPLPSSTLPQASTFKISNESSSTILTVTSETTIASAGTAQVGVLSADAGNEKSFSLTVMVASVSHDPTFVIKSKGGGPLER